MKTKLEKLQEVLKKENKENYADVSFTSSALISHRERLLVRIERSVFGNANIQKKEFELLCKKFPKLKNGLECYR